MNVSFFGLIKSRYQYLIGVFSLLVLSTGCATNRAFDFPAKGEVVTIRVKNQENIEMRPMRVIYRSSDCPFHSYTAAGERYKKSGYNEMQVYFEHSALTGDHVAPLQVNGGGDCKWKLSNVTIAFGYKYPDRLGSDLAHRGGNGITVLFDGNRGPRSGAPEIAEGNLLVRGDYYLWVFDGSRDGRTRSLSILGKKDLYPNYEALQAREIYYEPILHSEYVAYSVPHAIRKVGNFPTVTYPDGSTGVRSTSRPDFRRLECIRIPAGCKLKSGR